MIPKKLNFSLTSEVIIQEADDQETELIAEEFCLSQVSLVHS
jgi:hypothetical protein